MIAVPLEGALANVYYNYNYLIIYALIFISFFSFLIINAFEKCKKNWDLPFVLRFGKGWG